MFFSPIKRWRKKLNQIFTISKIVDRKNFSSSDHSKFYKEVTVYIGVVENVLQAICALPKTL